MNYRGDVLVTGHCGFIGQYLFAELLAQGYDMHGMDIHDYRGPPLDICTAKLPWATRVFHLAAKVDARTEDAAADAYTNIFGSIRIFQQYGEKCVFASSCAVHYDTPYGLAKRAAEGYARMFGCGIVRLCNIYGFGGHSVVDTFRRASTLFISGEGDQVRSYAPVEQAVAAFLACKPGELIVLRGREQTVKQVAAGFPEKERRFRQQAKWDIQDGRQRGLIWPNGDRAQNARFYG